jgi:predicted MarR family transcription regulator
MTDLPRKSSQLTDPEPWHLARDADAASVTAFEARLERVVHAYHRWKTACLAAVADADVAGESFTGNDVAILNVIRMKERPKSRVEVARLLNRDDTSNLQYGLRKLLRAGLVEKVDADARKTATYRATRKGIEVTEAYAELRRDLLISTTAGIEGSADALAAAGNLLDLMAGHYDQAAKLAVTRRY